MYSLPLAMLHLKLPVQVLSGSLPSGNSRRQRPGIDIPSPNSSLRTGGLSFGKTALVLLLQLIFLRAAFNRMPRRHSPHRLLRWKYARWAELMFPSVSAHFRSLQFVWLFSSVTSVQVCNRQLGPFRSVSIRAAFFCCNFHSQLFSKPAQRLLLP